MQDDKPVVIDAMSYAQFDPAIREWVFFDCEKRVIGYPTRQEIVAFVTGQWSAMRSQNEVDLTCAFYDENGTLLDTITSDDELRKVT
jgi:hypothetical protein